MAKRLTKEEKKEIIQSFNNGISINQLSEKFNCTATTISRNLKKLLGNEEYEIILKRISSNNKNIQKFNSSKISEEADLIDSYSISKKSNIKSEKDNSSNDSSFIEIAPLNIKINYEQQKDISSVPLASAKLPKTVFMVVDQRIELEIKLLKDYPEWQFLPDYDLDRKTIQIFSDIKNAKIACNKDKKVIKVPNTNVFKIVAPILLSRGISRIVSSDQLISL